MLVPSSSYLVALHLFRGSLLHALLNEMKGIDNKCWRCRGTKRVVKSSLKLLMALLIAMAVNEKNRFFWHSGRW